MKRMDTFLDKITMYRLVLYVLIGLSFVALAGSFMGLVPYTPFSVIASIIFTLIISWATNNLFSRVINVHLNPESVYITALILFFIISPANTADDFILLGWAAVLAESSKYIIALNKKHLFNPAAIAVVLTGIVLGQPVTWWAGSMFMNPFILVGGLLVVWKIRKFELVLSFIFIAILSSFAFGMFNKADLFNLGKQLLLESPLMFFAFIMLTEPLTTPPTRILQIYYGALVGFLFTPQLHILSLFSTPELALVLGNIFSFVVSPKGKMILPLKEKIQVAPDIYDFVFTPDRQIDFQPGQYMEWTIKHPNPDARGVRRYFTIASSPTEQDITLGVRFYEKSSTYKKAMLSLKPDDEIMAGGLAGDFVLPKDPNIKLCFIAGGIGITPYRSMIKYLIDNKQKRTITLLYAAPTPQEIVYEEIFEAAKNELGVKTVYSVDDVNNFPNWQGKVGHIDEALIMAEVPDYKERNFYISGPPSMVSAFKGILTKMGVPTGRIKTDYFPGFA